MNLDVDDQSLDIPCGKCGKKISEKIGRLKHNPDLTCPACGTVISVNADDLRRGMNSVQEALDDLRSKLKGMFK